MDSTTQHLLPIERNLETNNQQDDLINLTPLEITNRILNGCAIIKRHYEILDCEIVQFFNRNYWKLIPETWCEYLMQLSINELALFMDVHNDVTAFPPQMPESLVKIRKDIKNLSLSRKNDKYQRLTMLFSENNEANNTSKYIYINETEKLPFYENLLSFNKKQPPLSFLKYKCKDKKLVEIVVMGDLCFKASLERRIDFIVDIGAGLGHLSRCLAYFYNINVIAIEREAKMTEEAHRLDLKFQKLIRLKNNLFDNELSASITRITREITCDLTSQQFLDLITPSSHKNKKALKFALVGLHPCGNLAPTMLRLYKECDNCVFMNIASCCYNKMTICEDYKDNVEGFIGFPMNPTLKDSLHLGKNQLGLALHALESHQERFCNAIISFKADFYRALVEKFIHETAPEYADKRRKNVKTIGPGGVVNFKEYIQHSIEGIVLDQRIDYASVLEDFDEEKEFQRILAFSALRHMFAPLIETVVLLDRLLYLKRDLTLCQVVQRFDPKVSPRVHVISAFK